MHWADTTILGILLLGGIFGAMSGALWQLSRIIGLGVSLWASISLHEWASGVLGQAFFQGARPEVPRALAYPVVFIAVYVVLVAVTVLLEKTLRAARLQPLNRLLGAGLGVVKTGLVLGTLFLGLANYPNAHTQEIMKESVLAPALAEGMNVVISAIPEQYRTELQNGLKNLREAAQKKLDELRSGKGLSLP